MQSRIVLSLTACMFLGGCFKVPVSSNGKVSLENVVTQLVEAKAVSESKNVSAIDPNSAVEQRLAAPQTQALQGASVSIPPGSLAIAAEVVVEQAADFSETSITSEMGLAGDIQVSNTSAGMIIRPTENVDLKKPLSLAMPLPASLGMRLADTGSRYAVFYKYFDPAESKLVTGMKVVDGVSVKLSFDVASNRDVIAFEGYFGAYWAAILSREVKKEEVPPPKPAEEPIINVNKVSVIETKGIVKETEIIVKQTVQIPENVWQKPDLVKSPNGGRAVKLTAKPSRTLSSCKVDLFENPKAGSGISLEAPLGPEVEVPIAKKTEHTLVGRFRCIDDQGRFTTSPWSESLLIPAVPTEVVPASTVCSDANYPTLSIRAYENGTMVHGEDLSRISKCVYGKDVYVENGGSFVLAIGDGSQVCDSTQGGLGDGTFKLSCHKASSTAVGGNLMHLYGNYRMVVDFSTSEANPKMTLSKIPCDKGDFYALMGTGYDNPTFEAPSEANKMTHLGGCSFVYEKRASTGGLTLSYNDNIKFVNQAGNLSCGTRIVMGYNAYNDLRSNMWFENQCGSENRYFKFQDMITARAHRFELRLGKAAQERTNNSGSASLLQYNVETSCPDTLYLYGNITSAGQQALREVNSAYKEGECSYRFFFPADSTDPNRYKFRVGNETKTILCGGTGDYYTTADCSASAPELNPYAILQKGRIYEVYVTGSGANDTPVINNISVNNRITGCSGGLYMSSSLKQGVEATAAKAFGEATQCIFEKIWTPAAGETGFYLVNGVGDYLCGADYDPTRVPVLNGAEANIQCRGGMGTVGELSQIKPLNIVSGVSYKIRVDMRYRNINGMAKVSLSALPAPTASCTDNVNIISSDLLAGAAPNADNKMTYHGDCLYSYTILPSKLVPNLYQMNFRIKAASDADAYGRVDTAATLQTYDEGMRSQALQYSSMNLIMLGDVSNRATRIFFKKGAEPTVTAQNISYPYLNCDSYSNNYWVLAGAGGNAIPVAENRRFQKRFNTNVCMGEFLWDSSASNSSFHIEGPAANGYTNIGRCGLSASASLYGTLGSRDMVCNIPGDGVLKEVGNFAAGTYLISVKPPFSVEDRFQLKVDLADRLPNDPVFSSIVRGANGVNDVGAASPATPVSRQGAMSWTDKYGVLWFFGGRGTDPGNPSYSGYFNDVWKSNPTSSDSSEQLALVAGPTTINGIGNYQGSPATNLPSARSNAAVWYDDTLHGVYVFGGQGIPSDGNPGEGFLDDLWFYSIAAQEWTFLKGSHGMNGAGIYGMMGMPDVNSLPASRAGAVTWRSGGYLWMFGGMAANPYSALEYFNDIWRYDTSANVWTWMGGEPTRSPMNTASNTAMRPSGRANSLSWIHGASNKLYVYGGSSYYSMGLEIWTLDLSTLAWSLKRSDPNMESFFLLTGLFDDFSMPKAQGAAGWKITEDKYGILDAMGNVFVYKVSTNQFARPGSNVATYNQSYPIYSYMPMRSGALQLPSYWQGPGGSLYLFGGTGYDENGYWGFHNNWWKVTIP